MKKFSRSAFAGDEPSTPNGFLATNHSRDQVLWAVCIKFGGQTWLSDSESSRLRSWLVPVKELITVSEFAIAVGRDGSEGVL